MNKLLVLFLICYFTLTPVTTAGAQQRKAARAAVPPLKEIVREAFTKEFGMGKSENGLSRLELMESSSIRMAYNALTESNILNLIDTKSRPDTIFICFTLPDDGEPPTVVASHHHGDRYTSMYLGDLSHFNKYIRKHYEKYNLEWHYTNSYFVENSTKNHGSTEDELYSIIYSWDETAFRKHISTQRGFELSSEYALRIIRTRTGYKYDGMFELYETYRRSKKIEKLTNELSK